MDFQVFIFPTFSWMILLQAYSPFLFQFLSNCDTFFCMNVYHMRATAKNESLVEPMGDAWLQVQIHYYMFALFLLFFMLNRSFFTHGQ